ncbi:MAG TPA: hypothetical protein IGS53_11285 [Leptolyngbyaceae cyanobacterium M33_DOE_097]|uniref:Uncharacterized protein n=1 Tax=Oscillatoriales cyanobacterium SpSt-418 TaxID=2282169 RepID=A0A7C3PGJ7_9CYAN|nr:hypothetical protein [Leptolyngbyaceae cyanobacterium M33_DOE_097]
MEVVRELKVHSKDNCYLFTPEQMKRLEDTAVAVKLEPGTHTIKIKEGVFDYIAGSGYAGEAMVLLWIYGGKVINSQTDVEVAATWASLNGADDSLELKVLETATLNAFFFDTYLEDNAGELTLSITRV